MEHIDNKFKDMNPVETVDQIISILAECGIVLDEKWNSSGIENCWSVIVSPQGGGPFSNGKGVTQELARASAYGEFIERLQNGLFFFKYQSIIRNKKIDIQNYAPDAKYMTIEELIANGDWMDYLIDSYGGKLSRRVIAEQCKAYACADDGKILTLPFYSIFEDTYVYLPIAFVDQIYGTNGCCAGNTKEESWVHALSEIMERHAMLKHLLSGDSAPKIPEEKLASYSTVNKILKKLRSNKDLLVDIFDLSITRELPVISTRVINRRTKSYLVNAAADPVLEIAIQRTLTELLQGRNIDNLSGIHNGQILSSPADYPITSNAFNHLETGSGIFTANYFAEEITCQRRLTEFVDNSKKTNAELLSQMLSLYRSIGKPVYVRNFSFLGFNSYRFVIPGFSESMYMKLNAPVMEFAFGDQLYSTCRDLRAANKLDLQLYLQYNNMSIGTYSKYNNFGMLSGIPLTRKASSFLAHINRAYASYKVGRYADSIKYAEPIIRSDIYDANSKEYLSCVNHYLKLRLKNIPESVAKSVVSKFYDEGISSKLIRTLDSGLTPYDDYLLTCSSNQCESCQYKKECQLQSYINIVSKVADKYASFTNGQNSSNFIK